MLVLFVSCLFDVVVHGCGCANKHYTVIIIIIINIGVVMVERGSIAKMLYTEN